MQQIIFTTGNDWTGFILRLFLGAIMLPHGCQKLFGWMGGYGFNATMSYFTGTIKLPWILAFLVIIIEFFGSIGLLLGFATRIWAACLIVIMMGAIVTTNFKHGLFMNWFGAQAGEGYEYHLLVIGICVVLLLQGGGRWAADRLVS
jgi:putative oxidoreductase